MRLIFAAAVVWLSMGGLAAAEGANRSTFEKGRMKLVQSYCAICSDNATTCRLACNGAGTCLQACDVQLRQCREQNCGGRYR